MVNKQKLFTVEFDNDGDVMELHLNKEGAQFLKEKLERLIIHNENSDHHWFTPYMGGNELSSEKQNQSDNVKLINHLKILYWK